MLFLLPNIKQHPNNTSGSYELRCGCTAETTLWLFRSGYWSRSGGGQTFLRYFWYEQFEDYCTTWYKSTDSVWKNTHLPAGPSTPPVHFLFSGSLLLVDIFYFLLQIIFKNNSLGPFYTSRERETGVSCTKIKLLWSRQSWIRLLPSIECIECSKM